MTHNELKEILQDKLDEILELVDDNMNEFGNTCEQSQKVTIRAAINHLDSCINGIEKDDLL